MDIIELAKKHSRVTEFGVNYDNGELIFSDEITEYAFNKQQLEAFVAELVPKRLGDTEIMDLYRNYKWKEGGLFTFIREYANVIQDKLLGVK